MSPGQRERVHALFDLHTQRLAECCLALPRLFRSHPHLMEAVERDLGRGDPAFDLGLYVENVATICKAMRIAQSSPDEHEELVDMVARSALGLEPNMSVSDDLAETFAQILIAQIQRMTHGVLSARSARGLS